MAGNVDNVKVWSEADVFLGALAATIPTTNAAYVLNVTSGGTAGVVNEWDFVGILDGAAGFTEAQSNDASPVSGWGYGEIANVKKNLAITRTFTCLEDNLVTLGLRYDTSDVTVAGGNRDGDLAGRDLNKKYRAGFDLRSAGRLDRYITRNYAQIETLGEVTRGEDGVGTLPVTVKVYPLIVGGKPVYWAHYNGAAA